MGDPNLMAIAMQLIDEEEEQDEQLLMAIAQVAAAELIEIEDGPGLDDLVGPSWAPVTVNIDEYHLNPCFKHHFRMSRPMFELLTNAVRDHLIARRRLIRNRTDMP